MALTLLGVRKEDRSSWNMGRQRRGEKIADCLALLRASGHLPQRLRQQPPLLQKEVDLDLEESLVVTSHSPYPLGPVANRR